MISRSVEGEGRGVAPRYVTQPEVGGAGLGIAAVGDKTLFVRGEPMLVNTCGHVQRVDWLTAPIHPAVLATMPLEARVKYQHAIVRDGKSEVIDGNKFTPNLVGEREWLAGELHSACVKGPGQQGAVTPEDQPAIPAGRVAGDCGHILDSRDIVEQSPLDRPFERAEIDPTRFLLSSINDV